MIFESTPLVGNPTANSYPSADGRLYGRNFNADDYNAEVRGQRMRQYYHSVFRSDGIDVAVRNVAVVQRPWLQRFYPNGRRGRICCQAVSAQFRRGRLHVVADVDGIAAASLMTVIAGRGAQASGDIWVGDAAVDAQTRLRLIAYVGAESLFVPLLSVKDNLWFVVHLHCKEQRTWTRELVLAAANFVSLDLGKKVADLSQSEKFRLQVALELVLDPPVLFFSYPFDAMGLVEQNECTQLLSRLCVDVTKTVVLSTRSMPMPLHSAADTLLLFGAGGVVLFSGKCQDAISYFNSLRIPRHIPQPLWKGVLGHGAEAQAAEEDLRTFHAPSLPPSDSSPFSQRGVKAPESRLYSVICTPPRLSSRVFLMDVLNDTPPPLYCRAAEGGSASTSAVVEVATSGDLMDLAVEWAESESQTMFYAAKYYDSSVHAALLSSLDPVNARSVATTHTSPPPPRALPHGVWRFGVLLRYTLKQIPADAELLLGVAFLSIGLIVLTVAVHSQPENQGGMYNIRGLIFIAFVLVLFSNLAAIESMRDQLRVALGHRKRKLYGSLSFIVCLCVRIVLIRSVYLALFLPFVLFVLRSSYSLAILVGLVTCTHAAFQYLVTLLPSRRWVTWVSYAYFGYSIIFSGFLLNLRTLPPLLGVLSILRWGYGAVIYTWLHGKSFQCDGAGNTSYCYTGDDYLAVEGLENESVASSALILAVLGASMMGLLLVLWSLRSV
ncbi:ABC transporter-like protein [Leishmania donovani]|uniref:ABC_transporter-like_protein n=4 Tax=Leishmania donovani species complex TaxID=38574 RepID=A0A6L0XIL3_LEIIN|nr:ABC transporter-like protein [Leishmania infantum JPCM5]XP_003862518.1 ABC transporter-like protein [Leishmania donovani]CAC9507923.1 ABC_transporter-like_protein [Leishmania infantum]TPP52724.1 hypothetical protein CGC21_27995 [Leishmania donovani]CAJ1990570.1 ABC transporter-like protein [Leishmania donovani]CAM69659.1 ABC transporter-like protein [Leishmania infantum JPCM5]CBZ35825.1 ABC transporter-like protein [Leishmania donovani]|eukprot:XP_001466619.1 ABC transporter-like protein [Leishmania infantum JPCM5]